MTTPPHNAGHGNMVSAHSDPHAQVRWAVSVSGAIAFTIIFLLLVIGSETTVSVLVPPTLQLDYVVLPPEKVVEPPRPRPRQPPKQIPRDVPVEPPPPAQAPIEAAPDAPAPDLTSTPAPQPEPPKAFVVRNVTELDNTNFSPIVVLKPVYPWIAREADIEGYVDVELVVNEMGNVETFVLRKTVGHPLFSKETAKVLPKWRFPPPRLKGNKVKVRYSYRVEFKLD